MMMKAAKRNLDFKGTLYINDFFVILTDPDHE